MPVLSYRFPGPIRQLVGAETLRKTGSGVDVWVAVGGMVGDAVGVGTGSVAFAAIAETVISTRAATVRSRSGVSAAADSSVELSTELQAPSSKSETRSVNRLCLIARFISNRYHSTLRNRAF